MHWHTCCVPVDVVALLRASGRNSSIMSVCVHALERRLAVRRPSRERAKDSPGLGSGNLVSWLDMEVKIRGFVRPVNSQRRCS